MAYGVGAALRQERLRRQVPLADIARQTRISERFLNAIENENFGQLPGIVFTRNFVRQYADALQLDPDPLVAQLPKVDIADAVLPVPSARARRPAWDPRWNSVFSTAAWVILACGAAAAAYIHFNRPASTHAESPAPVAHSEPQPVQPVQVPASVPAPVATTVAQNTAQPHPVQVVLTAREQSWVQVSSDGKIAFTATLQPNDSRTVDADEQVKVVTGNAGGLAISLNGKTLDSLGPSGQVRTVRLTAEGPQFPPKIPAPQPPQQSDPL